MHPQTYKCQLTSRSIRRLRQTDTETCASKPGEGCPHVIVPRQYGCRKVCDMIRIGACIRAPGGSGRESCDRSRRA